MNFAHGRTNADLLHFHSVQAWTDLLPSTGPSGASLDALLAKQLRTQLAKSRQEIDSPFVIVLSWPIHFLTAST